MELPRSQIDWDRPCCRLPAPANWQAQFQSMAVQGEDLLAWYRAFQPDVAEDVTLSDLITGSVSASGWPLRWEDGAIESSQARCACRVRRWRDSTRFTDRCGTESSISRGSA